jgi:Spy/CpxP family protein refolding chaperone
MKLLLAISRVMCVVVGLMAMPAYSQPAKENDVKMVVFDPLFWQDRLKLTKSQSAKIRKINSQFYSSIMEASAKSRSQNQKVIQDLLSERSNQILSVFSQRQKAKWAKIETSYQSKG